MPKVTEILREHVKREGAYKTAKEIGLQYRSVREFLNGERMPSGPAIDTLAEYFELELQPKPKTQGPAHSRPETKETDHDNRIDSDFHDGADAGEKLVGWWRISSPG